MRPGDGPAGAERGSATAEPGSATAEPGSATAERGSATAELAVGLPALVLLLLFSLGAVDAVIARMQCVDAARDGALAAARGGDGTAAGQERAPHGAAVSITRGGERVRAEISVVVRPLGSHLPGIAVSAVAVADAEPANAEPADAGSGG